MKRNVSLSSLVIVTALLLILVIFVWEALSVKDHYTLQTFDKGMPLPTFSLPKLYEPDKFLTDNDLKGQVVLLNFWASWCEACKKEQNTLLSISKKSHIPIFGITFKDQADKAKAWLNLAANPYAIVATDPTGNVAHEFEVYGVPITFIIDKHGLIRYRYMGALSEGVFQTEIQPIVNELQHED